MDATRILARIGGKSGLNTAIAILGLLAAFAALIFVRDLLTVVVPVKNKPAGTLQAAVTQPAKSLPEYAPILQNNPFGFSAGELKPLSSAAGTSVSRTDLTLLGTVSGRKDFSYAIIADRQGLQEVFRTGADVFGLGKLGRVEKTRVFIRSSAGELEIPLKELADLRDIKPSDNAAATSFGRRIGDSAYQIDQQRVQQAIEKPDQIMTDARFIPNIIEGKQQGFILREVKPGGIYSSLGLQNGDVLVRINEFTISNPETALQAFTALRGIDRAQLDIIRSGAKMTMTYQIR